MTQPTHVYMSVHGSYSSGNWLGETAQFGLRMTMEEAGALPEKGIIYTPGPNGDVALSQGTQAGTHGTLTKSHTFRMGPVGSAVNWDADKQIDAAEDVWTFLDAVKGNFPTTFKWTHVKFCPISSLGKAIGNSSIYTYTTGVSGTSADQLPPQIALAISLHAPILGRKGRGRVYLGPLSKSCVGTDSTVATTQINNLRASFKTLIDNLNNVPGLPSYTPLVTIMSAGAAQAVRPFDVRTGNRVDTVRSRRQAVPETYTVTAL